MKSSRSLRQLLLVEDGPDDRELTLRVLRRTLDMDEVDVACDGAEALVCLMDGENGGGQHSGGEPGMIGLGLKLPKIDGLEVLRRRKWASRTQPIPILAPASSSRQHADIRRQRFEHGTCLVKPLTKEALLAAMGGLRAPPITFKLTKAKP